MIILRKLLCLFLSLIDVIIIQAGGSEKIMKKSDVTVTMNKYSQYQTINGFGTSACWWAQLTGDSPYADEAAKALYSKDGLALNIYRYNIGGGSKDNPNSRISGSRATESFYYYNEEKGKYEYDFTRDAAAQKMLEKCLSYGCIDTVVLRLRADKNNTSRIFLPKITKLTRIILSQLQNIFLKKAFR